VTQVCSQTFIHISYLLLANTAVSQSVDEPVGRRVVLCWFNQRRDVARSTNCVSAIGATLTDVLTSVLYTGH